MPRRFGGEFCCGGCRRVSQFPLLRRMLALAAMLATALIGVPLAFRVLNIYGVWPPLVFAGFVLAMLAVVSIATLLSALICAGSAYLVPRDH